ncbi:MAG: nucleotidyltransferase domain-containing protein [Firmicutes bacterium]|nr:nucleotidyltransferase domain-containing protein [Bacillota bacterium]
MPAEEIEELKRGFVEKLNPLRIYLFGSFAEGTYRDESDFDFYIVVSDDVGAVADATAAAYRRREGYKEASD